MRCKICFLFILFSSCVYTRVSKAALNLNNGYEYTCPFQVAGQESAHLICKKNYILKKVHLRRIKLTKLKENLFPLQKAIEKADAEGDRTRQEELSSCYLLYAFEEEKVYADNIWLSLYKDRDRDSITKKNKPICETRDYMQKRISIYKQENSLIRLEDYYTSSLYQEKIEEARLRDEKIYLKDK
ncbi:MAG: hypothetical protein H7A25_23880 [Leptospiraceae bacterium]|nr:hypothetical protein [Leptospiraceae bacterium]MCP5502962.1 hypothetical protein [Leptospiraceae bacterium]